MVIKRLGIVSALDAGNRLTLSGTSYTLSKILSGCVESVEFIDNLRPARLTWPYLLTHLGDDFTRVFSGQRFKQWFWRLQGFGFQWERTPQVARFYARTIEHRLCKTPYDLLFTDKGSVCVAFLNTSIPILYCSDATFRLMLDYYPEFTGLSRQAIQYGETLEQRALEKSALVIFASEWAAASAEKDYGINRRKIRVIPRPGSLDKVPPPDEVLHEKPMDVCRLLFLGVDWERKGGPIAVEVTRQLNRIGIRSQLTIGGVRPSNSFRGDKDLKWIGFLDKNQPDHRRKMNELLRESHFLLLPTRAECFGQVFAEAAAYALPSLATRTGGVPSAVYQGLSGFLFDVNASPEEYVSMIRTLWQAPSSYYRLCQTTRRWFDEHLSPEVVSDMFRAAIRDLGGQHGNAL